MSPPHFLKGGEEVVLGVDKLGTQTHKVSPLSRLKSLKILNV